MTDNNNDKLRAVFFAALMVLWVFAGSVAFAGSAAADITSTNTAVTDVSPDTPRDSASYTINITAADAGSSGNTLEEVTLDFNRSGPGNGAYANGLSYDNIQTDDITVEHEGNDIYNGGFDTTTAEDGTANAALSIDISNYDTGNINAGDNITVTVDNIRNPYAGTYTVDAALHDSNDPGNHAAASQIASSSANFQITGTTSQGDATWQTGGSLRWQGQGLFIDVGNNVSSDLQDYQLRNWDAQASDYSSAVGSTVRELTMDDGYRVIQTDNLEGAYVITAYNTTTNNREALITDQNGILQDTTRSSADDPHLEVGVQDLNTSFVEDEINRGDSATVEVDSARTNFALNVTSDSFTGPELEELFPEANQIGTTDTAQFTGVTNQPDELEFNTSSDRLSFDLETGNYTFDFGVNDTTASDDATITVGEEISGDANFDESQYRTERGDIVNITYTTQELDSTTLHIGGAEDGYNATLVLEPNDDGEVAVEMNTFTAASNNQPSDVFTVTKGSLEQVVEEEELVGYKLESGNYDLEITAGNQTQDLSRLRLAERSYDGLTLHTAPSREWTRMQSKDRLLERIDDGWVTESEEIAVAPSSRSNGRMGDVMVYQIEATGLEGYVKSTDNVLKHMLTDQNKDYFDLEIEQQNPRQNRQPKQVALNDSIDNGAFALVPDTDNDTYYLVVKSDNLNFTRAETPVTPSTSGSEHVAEGDMFNSTFQINDAYEEEFIRGSADNVSKYEEFEIVDREANFDTRGGNITAQAVEGAEITGETTVAPGTELTIFVEGESGDEGAPVFENSVTRVNADGTFNATFDFSGAEDGQQFTATISSQSFEDNAETPGVFGEPTGASYDVTDLSLSSTSVEAGEDVDVSATVTNSGDVEGNQTISFLVDDTEVDSQTVTLQPGESADVSSTISTSDLSGDVTVEVASADDSASTTLTVETEATPTATETEAPGTETATATETASQDQPGFGAGLALIALLGAALLAARRNAF